MKVTLDACADDVPCGFKVIAEDGREAIFQSDWDFPSLASTFGYCPCECGRTDGTVDCKHKTATQMISEAYDFILDHDGEEVEDPGYFD